MPVIVGQTVYILGAGASAQSGAPLMRNFLREAEQLARRGLVLRYMPSFERVLEWSNNAMVAGQYMNLYRNNVEEMVSMIELDEALSVGGEISVQDITNVIVETPDHSCRVEGAGGKWSVRGDYPYFAKLLREINLRRLGRVGRPDQPDARDAVITFNYDVSLELALLFTGDRPSYGLQESAPNATTNLFKLHGSVNWGSCIGCSSGTANAQIVETNLRWLGQQAGSAAASHPYLMGTDYLPGQACASCGKSDLLRPYLVPPTWAKSASNKIMQPVWRRALEAVRNAVQVVIIGYSMPESDVFFKYFLSLALKDQPSLHKIVVVDPNLNGGTLERFQKVFSPQLTGRGQLQFEEMDFERFLTTRMEFYAHDLDYRSPGLAA